MATTTVHLMTEGSIPVPRTISHHRSSMSTSSSHSSSSIWSMRFASSHNSIDETNRVEELHEDSDGEFDDNTTMGDAMDPPSIGHVKAESAPTSPLPLIPKRPRGRPRKNPHGPTSPTTPKGAKGRSKTGCATCRKRKKKCDETKPECLNCLKNSVVCEGYPPKRLWQSGKEVTRVPKSIELPTLIHCVETQVDRDFLDHFYVNVSTKLSVSSPDLNPFRLLILPMALRHKGLMHSLLCLAGTHLAGTHMTGEKTLDAPPPHNLISERKNHHYLAAVSELQTVCKKTTASGDIVDDPTVAATLMLCLNAIVSGETTGESLMHLDFTRKLASESTSQNEKFKIFIWEFFTYHDVISCITDISRRVTYTRGLPPILDQRSQHDELFVGVLDGLFDFIARITAVRQEVRSRIEKKEDPWLSFETLKAALELDDELRQWTPAHAEGSQRWVASMLYKHSAWVYLYRTIQDSLPSEKISEAVDGGVEYLRMLDKNDSTQSIMLLPLFLLGCAAFKESQRTPIRKGFDDAEGFSQLGNIRCARRVVERVWEMMDAGDRESWNWETIIDNLGYKFLVT